MKPRGFLVLFVISLFRVTSLYSAPHSEITGDVRVQILSPALVRLEVKGPSGFEDRE